MCLRYSLISKKGFRINITKDTKIIDILNTYPQLKEKLPKLDPRFKKINSPMAKIVISSWTMADISKKSGYSVEKLIAMLEDIIDR